MFTQNLNTNVKVQGDGSVVKSELEALSKDPRSVPSTQIRKLKVPKV